MNKLWVAAALGVMVNAADAGELGPGLAKKLIDETLPGVVADKIQDAEIPGFYEVVIGTRLLYLSKDGKYMFLGDLVDTKARMNLSEARRAELTIAKLDAVDPNRMIMIGPEQAKRHITVFTDVDCPYCARFHRDIPKLNAAGLEVRYLLFPRAGIGSKSYERAVGVWCADDQVATMTIAKAGGDVAPKTCDDPVKQHLELGQAVGVRGTPAIFLDDGTLIPGYVPAARLLAQLGLATN